MSHSWRKGVFLWPTFTVCLWTNRPFRNYKQFDSLWHIHGYVLGFMDYFEMCYSECVARMKGKWKKKWHRFFNCESLSFPLDAIIYPSFLELYFFLLRESFLNDCRHHSNPLLYFYHLTSLLIIRYRLAGIWLFVVTYHQPIESE